ncbi:MAG: 50S ribosomal protein L15 [Candidatus Saccharimonadales bacterium]
MKAHELQVSKNRPNKRVGRGISAGQGKTAGRGTKGYGSRAGSRRRPGFEGGQNQLMTRIPKLRGFKSKKAVTETVYTGQLDSVKGTVDNFSLYDAGLVKTPYSRVKLIVRGDVTKKASIKLQAASAPAIEAVAKAGGSFDAVEQVKRSPKKSEEK